MGGKEAISIHALRKESDTAVNDEHADTIISIHALRKESDLLAIVTTTPLIISIHALRKESDMALRSHGSVMPLFQSTLSVRRATWFDWFD